MLRARFKCNVDDPRPVKFPPPGPFWISGYQEGAAIAIAYVDTEEQITEFWPEADDIDITECSEITFSERFPKPKWWKPKD